MLRERLFKGIDEDLPTKEDFEKWCDFLRDKANEIISMIENKGKRSESNGQAADSSAGGPGPSTRHEYAAVSPSQGMVTAAVTPSLNKEEGTVVEGINFSHLLELKEDSECLRQRVSKAGHFPSVKLNAAQAEDCG